MNGNTGMPILIRESSMGAHELFNLLNSWHLKKDKTKVQKPCGSSMQVKNTTECSCAFCNIFTCIKRLLVLKTYCFLSFFKWPLKTSLEVIKLELILRLIILRNDWLLADTCPQAANHCALF